MQVSKEPGTYVLVLNVPERRQVRIGSLGTCVFDAGWYLYVGSAMGGLRQRLSRHARDHKRMHWHIDYLLARATLCETWYHLGPQRLECLWAQALGGAAGCTPYAKRLGASDCACFTHLVYTQQHPSLVAFARLRPRDPLLSVSGDDLRDLALPAKS